MILHVSVLTHVLTFVLHFVPWTQLRRERIAERMKALQELVPNSNKVIDVDICLLYLFLLWLHLFYDVKKVA